MKVVNSWVRSSWRCIDSDLAKKGLKLAGLSGEVENTFIAKHDVYGENLMDAWAELQNAEQEVLSQIIESDIDDEMLFVKSE